MKKIVLFILFTISLLAVEKEDISSVMKDNINTATNIIKLKELNIEEKAEKVFPLFDNIFDYGLMTKLSLGKENWTKMNAQQREEFQEKFVQHLKQSYIKKLNLYTDEKLNIVELKNIKDDRVWLLTQMIGTQDTYDITYKFYKTENRGWLIYDVDIIGVSLLQIYRAQFDNALAKGSYETLLSKLEIK